MKNVFYWLNTCHLGPSPTSPLLSVRSFTIVYSKHYKVFFTLPNHRCLGRLIFCSLLLTILLFSRLEYYVLVSVSRVPYNISFYFSPFPLMSASFNTICLTLLFFLRLRVLGAKCPPRHLSLKSCQTLFVGFRHCFLSRAHNAR